MSIFSRMNNVLITGSAGFIGHHLGIRMLGKGISVYGMDDLNENYDASLKQRNLQLLRDLSEETGTSFEFEELDLLDRSALSSHLEEHDVDAVVHAAALAGSRQSMEQPSRCLRTNVHGTSNLLEQVMDQDLERFLLLSSASVYGNHDEVPFHEKLDDLEPVSTYGVSKHAAEMICRTYQKHHDAPTSVVRLSTVYGPRQRPDMAVHTFSRHLERNDPIPIYGGGEMVRDFTYITDAIDGICSALGQEDEWGLYNIGGSETHTVSQLVEQLGEVFDRDPDVQQQPVPEGEPVRVDVDLEKAKQELGYEPDVSFEDGIKRFADWFRSRSAESTEAATGS